MTGSKYNKKNLQKGQVLLIVIMLLATVSTIVMTMSFRSSTDTQITKLEIDSQKALAAGEAAIAKALQEAGTLKAINQDNTLRTGTLQDLGLDNLEGIDMNNSTVTVSILQDSDFVSPTIRKDGIFLFYLTSYDYENNSFGADYYSNDLNIYFGSGSGYSCLQRNLPALELTFIHSAGGDQMERKILDPCNSGKYIGGTNVNHTFDSGGQLEDTRFEYRIVGVSVPAESKLLVVRSLYGETKIGFESTVGFELRPQGKYITTDVETLTGVKKKIQLYQSNPQIPSEYWVTSF